MKHTVALVLAVSLLAGVSGCATSSGAGLDRSKEVLDSFLGFNVLPGYRYYTMGPGETPDAILGIKSGYTLKSEVWKETEMTSELLKRQVRQMNNLFSAEWTGLIGAAVLNDQGEQVGIWYSAVGTTEVNMISATEVAVGPPNPLAINQLKTKLR
jgi:predicted small secreted protein